MFQRQESTSGRKLFPLHVAVQLRQERLAGAWCMEVMVGFAAALCKRTAGPSAFCLCCPSCWVTLCHCCLEHFKEHNGSRPSPQGFLALLLPLAQHSRALSLALMEPRSHSSVQLFLLECEGFSGYKLYLAEVKVYITQPVGHKIQSLNSLVLVFLLHSFTNGLLHS